MSKILIESTKNSRTVHTRETLEDLTKEFETVCADGDIIYLGTPQSVESIYNNLKPRGYAIRIWPGRYVDQSTEEEYAEHLAPMLRQDMQLNPGLRSGCGLTGLLGVPTCPEMFDESSLLTKELSLGMAKFQLQYMLNTSLSDLERYPLKLHNLIVADMSVDKGPVLPVWSNNDRNVYQSPNFGNKYKLYRAVPEEYEYRQYDQIIMYIDPAGSGKNDSDEMGYAVIGLIGAYVYILDVGGVPGGYEEHNLLKLVRVAKKWKAKTVCIEENYGKGAHKNMLKPLFAKEAWPVILEDIWETGQKELRIIDALEPLLSSHRLVISPEALEDDAKSISRYPTGIQLTYRFIYQLKMITRDKGCLRHEDRLDALAGAIRYVVEKLDFDTHLLIEAKRRKEDLEVIKTWNDPVSRRVWLTDVQENVNHNRRNRFNSLRSLNLSTRRNRFR